MKKQVPLLFLLLFNVYIAGATTLLTPPSATISYNTPVCQSSGPQNVVLTGTAGGTFSASPSLMINPTTGTIDPSSSPAGTYVVTYTIPAGVDPAFATTTSFTINPTPNAGADGSVFVCDSSTTPINLYSLITGEQTGGTWVRVIGTGGVFNAALGIYTPAFGATTSAFDYTIVGVSPCINDSSLAIVNVSPQPNAGTDGTVSVCNTSTTPIDLFNLIIGEQAGGSWIRSSGTGGTFNSASATFTPYPDATTSTFIYALVGSAPCLDNISQATITIGNIQPQFANLAPICPNSTPPSLPTTSLNGITGTWSPATIDTSTSGLSINTFTPNPGQCAVSTLLTINVANSVLPTFTFGDHNLCLDMIPVLPLVSNNGISGTWSPSEITVTAIYTFTPNSGQCATTTVETLSVSQTPNATMSASTTMCEGQPSTIVFSGTPNAVVNYSVDGTALQSIVLSTGGAATYTLLLSVGVHMLCLNNVTTSCSHPINQCISVNVFPTIDVAPIAHVHVCDHYTLPALQLGDYYTGPNATGTMLHAGDEITETLQVIYVYASNACSFDEESFIVNVSHTIVIPPMLDVTACGAYQLPDNWDAGYYSLPGGPSGGGMHLTGPIYNTQTIYLYASTASTPSCVSESSYHVTIIPIEFPTISTVNNINYIYVDGTTVVQPLLLNGAVAGDYSYQWFESHNPIVGATSSTYLVNNHIDQGWHYYSVRITNNDTGCVTECQLFQVFETPVPAPVGDPNQTFTQGQTLADVVVIGSNIQWYDALGRNVNANPLPMSTVLMNGATYYASQTINGHESPGRFMITIQLLANNTFHFKNLTYTPNPLENMLNIKSTDTFKNVKVYNSLGQEVYQQECNTLDLKLELGFLQTGNYFIKLESDKNHQVLKVIKK